MKILIYGAGPLGSLFATRLHQGGHDVSILARGQRLQDLREHSIVIENAYTGEQTVTHVKVVETLEPDDVYDLIMVMMRKNHAIQILSALAANKNSPTILFMMNNAAGPDELVEALGKERVMMGFPLPGGERDGHIMRIIPDNKWVPWRIPIGEVDGSITARTLIVANALQKMPGFHIEVRRDMDAWLKYHVALLMPGFGAALYGCNTNIERLSRTRDALVLSVRATKEAFRALQQAGVPYSPRIFRIYPYIPEPVLVWFWRKAAQSRLLKVGGEAHAAAARDEMTYLMNEFMAFIKAAGAETPTIDRLFKYYDPQTPSMPDGSSQIPMNKKGVVLPLVGIAAGLAAVFALRSRRKLDAA